VFSLAQPVPVRHGKCGLHLLIDSSVYSLRRSPAVKRGAKVWRMRQLEGPRAGRSYSVVSYHSGVSCTCPDSTYHGAVCKHVKALQALQLVNPRAVPDPIFVAATFAGAGQEGGARA
jgi:hypothetical protein